MNKETLLQEFRRLKTPISTTITAADLEGKSRLAGVSLEKSVKKIKCLNGYFITIAVLLELVSLVLAYVNCYESTYFEIFFFPLFLPYIFHLILTVRYFKRGKQPSQRPVRRYVVYGICYGLSLLLVICSLCHLVNGLSLTAFIMLCVSIALFVSRIILTKKANGYQAYVNSLILPNKEKLEAEKMEKEKARKLRLKEVREALLLHDVYVATVEDIEKLSYASLCPICNSRVAVDKNYVVWHYGFQEEKRQEVIVYNGSVLSSNPLNSTYYFEKDKDFPATRRSCPKCQYEVFEGYASTYTEKERWEEDEDGGSSVKYYVPKRVHYFKIEPGRIATECFEEWKRQNKVKLGGNFTVKVETEADKEAAKQAALQKKLVKCVDCGKSFSPHAKACPECGCPIEVCLKGSK